MMTHKLSVRRLLAKLIDKNETLMDLPVNNTYADIGTIALFMGLARWSTLQQVHS